MEINNELKWVTEVEIIDDYKLRLTFNDGKESIFDCLPLMEKYKIYSPLKDKKIFRDFNLDGWTINWLNGTIDIAPEYLYENSVTLSIECL